MKSTQLAAALVAVLGITVNGAVRAAEPAPAGEADKSVKAESKHKEGKEAKKGKECKAKECKEKGKEGSCKGKEAKPEAKEAK